MIVREGEPLAPRTTFRVGGPARFYVEPTSAEELAAALELARARSLPAFLLGGGSNLVVADAGLEAVVVRVGLRGLTFEEDGGGAIVRAAAGEPWDDVVARCVGRDLVGLECLSGIPGDVGATPIQNVGAYGQEVADTLTTVSVIDRATGRASNLEKSGCGFGYRDSVFKREARGRYVVTAVAFRLSRGSEPTVRYAELERALEGRARTAALVRETVIRLRRGKGMVLDDADRDTHGAGSFFTNPIVDASNAPHVVERARSLGALRDGENMPSWPAGPGRTKLSAAWLIERAGFKKGTSRGRAAISSKHSLALTNRGGATAAEVVALAREIRAGVADRLGVHLAPEPELVGFTPDELGELVAAGEEP